MLDVSGEILKVALIGTAGYLGKIGQDWLTARRAQTRAGQERWEQDKRQYYLPLVGAARALDARLTLLARIYQGREHQGPHTPAWLSRDFRELYLLAPDEIRDLYQADPNKPRRDEAAAQRLRTRMCRELNFATSSIYLTARYLAVAGLARQALDDDHSGLPAELVSDLRQRIGAVSSGLTGQTEAGLAIDQQDSIGEMMRTDNGQVITQFEFRRRLLEVPGWEQYTALLTFFITEDDDVDGRPDAARFVAKLPFEVLETVRALRELGNTLDEVTTMENPRSRRSAPVTSEPDPW